MRIRAMYDQVVWEIVGLFERIGTVQDGINTIARPPAVTDRPGAAELTVPRGEIRFEGIRFHYGRDVARLGGGVIEDLSLTLRPGEKVGRVGGSGAGQTTTVHRTLAFHNPLGGP